MQTLNVAKFLAYGKKLGKTIFESPVSFVKSWGTIDLRDNEEVRLVEIQSRPGQYLLSVSGLAVSLAKSTPRDSKTGRPVGDIFEIREFIADREFTIKDGISKGEDRVIPKGHVSFSAYVVVEETEE
jgi:hypothetical protein